LVNCHKRAHCDTTQNSIGLKPKNTRSNNFSQKTVNFQFRQQLLGWVHTDDSGSWKRNPK